MQHLNIQGFGKWVNDFQNFQIDVACIETEVCLVVLAYHQKASYPPILTYHYISQSFLLTLFAVALSK